MDGEVIGVKGNQRPKDGEANIERKKDGKRNRETHAEHKDGKQNLLGYSTEEESSNEVEKPFVGMVFESEEAARKYYDAYARHGGFSTHVGQYSRAKPDGPIVSWDFSCSREVFKRKNVESCNAVLRIERKNTENWIVTKFVEDHNHSVAGPSKVHYLRPRRHFAGASKNVVEIPDSQADAMVSMDGNHDALKYAEEGAVAVETYDAASSALREGSRKIAIMKKHVAKVRPPTALASGNPNDDSNKKTPSTTSDTGWPWQDAMPYNINLNDVGVPIGDLNQPTMTSVAINRDASFADNTVVYTCFKSMTWMIESKNPANKVAVINLKLQDYGKSPAGETEVQFRLTRVTLEPMLKSMAYINQQLSMPANRVAVINLKLQDTKTTSGETEVKFQVSRDALGSMLRSMAYIHEQL
nr:protein FAR1-RELATED SEQUENCE 3-like [Ipomoea batatas]